jgi:hypothetical protein
VGRSQLRGLDFRKRVGVIAQTIPGAGPAASSVVKGEDVMTICPDVPGAINVTWLSDELRRRSGGWLWIPGTTVPLTESQVKGAGGGKGGAGTGSEGTATVTLRGGHIIRGVPWSFLADPDGTNWTLNPDGTFKEKRGFGQRLRHAMQNWKTYQPRCQASEAQMFRSSSLVPLRFPRVRERGRLCTRARPWHTHTHTHTHSLTHSLTRSLTHSLTHSLIHTHDFSSPSPHRCRPWFW